MAIDNEATANTINELLTGLLGLDADTVLDRGKPLEAMGLDSILAMDLITAMEERFGLELEDTVHVDHPTIAALALHISRSDKAHLG